MVLFYLNILIDDDGFAFAKTVPFWQFADVVVTLSKDFGFDEAFEIYCLFFFWFDNFPTAKLETLTHGVAVFIIFTRKVFTFYGIKDGLKSFCGVLGNWISVAGSINKIYGVTTTIIFLLLKNTAHFIVIVVVYGIKISTNGRDFFRITNFYLIQLFSLKYLGSIATVFEKAGCADGLFTKRWGFHLCTAVAWDVLLHYLGANKFRLLIDFILACLFSQKNLTLWSC